MKLLVAALAIGLIVFAGIAIDAVNDLNRAQDERNKLLMQLAIEHPIYSTVTDFASACKQMDKGLTVGALDVDGQYIALVCVTESK